jgi:streptomycin 3"-adenylyltransferase
MSLPRRFDDLPLSQADRRQLTEIVGALDEVLGAALIGSYVHGSVVLGGLHPHSDLDVLALTERESTVDEKARLFACMLELSGRYPSEGSPRPIELTVVVGSEVRPWRYPPERDLQFGEWLREGFERGDPEVLRPVADPDLAVLCTMVLRGDAALVGPPPTRVIGPVPWADVLDACLAEATNLISGIAADSHTRNVVLTLARIWSSVASGQILAKDAAAEWALPQLPEEYRPVLARARDMYLGRGPEGWNDVQDLLPGFADAVGNAIHLAERSEARP